MLRTARAAFLNRPWAHAQACAQDGHKRDIDPSLYLVTLRKESGYVFDVQVKSYIPCAAQILDMAYWHILASVSPDARVLLDWIVSPITPDGLPANLPACVFRGSHWTDPDKRLVLRNGPKAVAKPLTTTESFEAFPEAMRYMLGFRGQMLLRAPDRINRTFVREVLRRTLRDMR